MKEKKFLPRLIRKVLVLSCLAILFLAIMSFTAFRPDNLGAKNGRLAALPDAPNCVSSQTEVEAKQMNPLTFESDRPLEKIKAVLKENFPRARLVESGDDYLHFEFTSLLFRFVDDVEFLVVGKDVHFRSASRVGYSDMGANRKRMEQVRKVIVTE